MEDHELARFLLIKDFLASGRMGLARFRTKNLKSMIVRSLKVLYVSELSLYR